MQRVLPEAWVVVVKKLSSHLGYRRLKSERLMRRYSSDQVHVVAVFNPLRVHGRIQALTRSSQGQPNRECGACKSEAMLTHSRESLFSLLIR